MPLVSIIVIGRNEEQYLEQSLRSAISAAAEFAEAEVVYVDSASTDRSVEIASSLGVRVLLLNPEWKLSAAAGRYIGFHHTSGEYLLFIDGDTIVHPHFLTQAIPYFSRQNLGGLTGYLEDLDEHGKALPYVGKRHAEAIKIAWLRGGCSMYRRQALAEIGTFNPCLISEEEAELAVRLKKNGWELLNIPVPMASHLRGLPVIAYFKRSFRLGRFATIGKTLRYALRDGNALEFCRMRLQPTMLFIAVWSLLIIGIPLLMTGYFFSGSIALILFGLGLALIVRKKKSLTGLFHHTFTHGLILIDVLIGMLFTGIEDESQYPLDAVEIPARVSDINLPTGQISASSWKQ